MADARAVLTSARLPLLKFHQALIQAERRRHEARHGTITPAQFLQELMNAEAFAWLKPMTALILKTDDRLDDAATTPESFTQSLEEVRELLKPGTPDAVAEHLAALAAEAPELAAFHDAVLAALGPLN